MVEQYELNDIEKCALQVLLTYNIEETPAEEKVFIHYNARQVYESIYFKLFKPSNISEGQRKLHIKNLEKSYRI